MGDSMIRQINMRFEIAKTFASLVVEGDAPHRVTVTDIARRMGIDRKTFYYYFETTDNLVQWIFRKAMSSIVSRPEFSSAKLAYPQEDLHDPFPELPFYVQVKDGDNFIHQMIYFKYWGRYFQQNREYYRRIFMGATYFEFFDYITLLYFPAIEADIRIMLGDREMPEVVIKFLTEYHTMGIFGRVLYHYTRTQSFMMQDELNPFFSYGHRMIQATIDLYCDTPEKAQKQQSPRR
ncbi:TetR family transcriptional regulator [Gordonibacter sp.]|uniref:TetR family transcriptional regulator n=1 Tax=Gordonibacter sp. TaxID=1968902 RepID=UPI0025C534C4|nr:TetR family transcriptional regulator [Gordonibacter sp.]